eukprot:CAMPEP_0117050154 /NCGR_PEP_ID=MMETSP0472-20121206/34630_1 /TAXON_ID=693140 ORGANISM="Tiarina fusus, Strain LIS" /NCGR_SAMPLE_ID=MMETSP0472 /ASSEMBLY_ACC=CAM_ASM_000603 /LENGTH=195 /DNA_ID=CAMNT_0004763831 /DNA_START=103 /DNA_END=690 /DNA_ORIENTATION=+
MTFTPTNNMMNKKSRRIRFAIDDASADQQQQQPKKIESPRQPLVLTDETCAELWYQPDEIACLKHDTRNMVLYGQNSFGETDMSGLERYSMERSRHKKEVIRYVLMVHRMGKDADCLGDASRNSTSWAAGVAAQQGYNDYVEVYNPLPELVIDDAEYADFMRYGDKRKAEPLSAAFCGRRVRQRSMSSAQMLQTA